MKTGSIKIIVIDDDPFTLTMTGETIKRTVADGQMIGFSTAADALEYLETENESSEDDDTRHPGIIISDLHMPGIDGFQFLDRFAKLDGAIRNRYSVFILSSTTNEDDRVGLSEKACFAGFCSKPLTTSKFTNLMRTAYREFEKRNPG